MILDNITSIVLNNQDAAVETAAVKRITEESASHAKLNRLMACRKIWGSFKQNLLPHLIKMCNKRAKKVRCNAEDKYDNTNVR